MNPDVKLTCIRGSATGQTFAVTREKMTLGRDEGADLRLDDPSLAPRQLQIVINNGRVYAGDASGGAGFLLNGRRADRSELKNFDKLQVGDITLHVDILEGGKPPSSPTVEPASPTPPVTNSPVDTTQRLPLLKREGEAEEDSFLMLEDKEYILEIYGGGSADKWTHRLELRSTLLGSGASDLVLDDPTVSRKHCQIEVLDTGKLRVKDLGSTNKTLLNGTAISIAEARGGDVLKLGATRIKIIHRPIRADKS